MKALVTGSTGFVGSHLVERLLVAGREVVCLLRPASRPRWIAHLAVEHRRADPRDADALARAVADADCVFHVAGLTRARGLADYLAANAEATARLAAAAARAGSNVRRFVYVSSLAAAGPNPTPEPLDERAEPHPYDAYGQSKLAGERAARAVADRLEVTVVRPPGVYGPRDRNFLPLFRSAVRLRRVAVLGRADRQFSLVHVRDLAEGIYLAGVTPEAAGRTYFIAGGTHTQGELAAALAAAVGIEPRVLRVPSWLARLAGEWGELKWTLTGRAQILSRRKVRDVLQPRWTCTWARAQGELGYRQRVALTDGLRQTGEWYRRQGWLRGE